MAPQRATFTMAYVTILVEKRDIVDGPAPKWPLERPLTGRAASNGHFSGFNPQDLRELVIHLDARRTHAMLDTHPHVTH